MMLREMCLTLVFVTTLLFGGLGPWYMLGTASQSPHTIGKTVCGRGNYDEE